MKKLKRLTDITKGLIAIAVILGSVPFIIYPIVWYWIKCFNIFF